MIALVTLIVNEALALEQVTVIVALPSFKAVIIALPSLIAVIVPLLMVAILLLLDSQTILLLVVVKRFLEKKELMRFPQLIL